MHSRNVFEFIVANRSNPDFNDGSIDWKPGEATGATAAQPGSAEKIKVFQQRLLRGESLWHDRDSGKPILKQVGKSKIPKHYCKRS